MKKSKAITLILVSGLLNYPAGELAKGINKTKGPYGNQSYQRYGFYANREQLGLDTGGPVIHSFPGHGGFGWFGHRHHSGA